MAQQIQIMCEETFGPLLPNACPLGLCHGAQAVMVPVRGVQPGAVKKTRRGSGTSAGFEDCRLLEGVQPLHNRLLQFRVPQLLGVAEGE